MSKIVPDEPFMMIGSNIRSITYWGLWPSDVKNNPFLNKLHRVYGNFNFCVFLLFFTLMTIKLFYIWKDILQLMYNLSIWLLYAIIMAKISVLLFDRKTCRDLMLRTKIFQDKIMDDYSERNKEIFVRHVTITRIVSKWFQIMVFSTCGLLIIPGFLAMLGLSKKVLDDGTVLKTLPFSCYLPFDDQEHHTAALFIEIIICLPGTSYVAIWDTWAFSLMMHPICQIKILQNTLIHLGDNPKKSVYESTKDCIKLHQDIIKYVKDLDALVTTIMFLDFLVYAVLLCSIGFRAMFDKDIDFANLLSCTVYLGAVLVQLFMFYWTGNLLMIESVEIANAAWKSNWYKYDKNVAKLLLILMLRAQKPLKISVGRFYDMNLESFMVIIRAWYSYLTLLNQMRED